MDELLGNVGAFALDGTGIDDGSTPTSPYDFTYATGNLPPSGAASTGSQVESGGSGFNWNQLLSKALDTYVQTDSNRSVAANANGPVYRAPSGALYPAGQAIGSTVPQVRMSSGMLMLGAAGLLVLVLALRGK